MNASTFFLSNLLIFKVGYLYKNPIKLLIYMNIMNIILVYYNILIFTLIYYNYDAYS